MAGNLADGIDTAVTTSPELYKKPELAVAAGQSQDPATSAQVISHVQRKVAHANAAIAAKEIINPDKQAAIDEYTQWQRKYSSDNSSTSGPVLSTTGPQDEQFMQHASKALESFGGALGSFQRGLDHAVGDVANTLNSPLRLVQHLERYYHDIEARHGRVAAILALVPVAGATAVGAVLGGAADVVTGGAATPFVNPASLGALFGTAASSAESQIAFKDSWDRTADGSKYHDPNTGETVSLGRDLASQISRQPVLQKVNGKWVQVAPGSKFYQNVSGIGDALSDMALDPAFRAGKVVAGARSAEGIGLARTAGEATGGPMAYISKRVGQRLGVTGTQVADAFETNHLVQNGFKWIARESSPTIIGDRFPMLHGTSGLINDLANATTSRDVLERFIEAAEKQQIELTSTVPSMSTTRRIITSLADPASQYPVISTLYRGTHRIPAFYNPALKAISRTRAPLTGDYLGHTMFNMLLSTEGRRVAADVVDDFHKTTSLTGKLQLYENSISRVMANYMMEHKVLDQSDLDKVNERISEVMSSVTPQVTGLDRFNRQIGKSENDDGEVEDAPLLQSQLPQVPIPDPQVMKHVAKELAGAKLHGRLEEFAYDHVTTIFKHWTLLTPAFVYHVTGGEVLSNSARLGLANMIKDRAIVSTGQRISDDEAGLLSKMLMTFIGKTTSPRKLKFGADYVNRMRDHFGLGAHHNVGGEFVGDEQAAYKAITGEFKSGLFSPTNDLSITDVDKAGHQARYTFNWAAELNENARDPSTRLAAKSYLEATSGRAKTLDTTAARKAQAARSIVKDWLDNQPEAWLQQFPSHYNPSPMGRQGMLDPHEDWARQIVEKVRGSVVRGKGNDLNEDLLQKIADGHDFTETELGKIPLDERPGKIKGRSFMPVPQKAWSFFRAVNENGFRKVLNPMIDWLSRTPLAFEETFKEYKRIEPLIDDGKISEDQAFALAESRATVSAIRFVHNINERTQWAEKFRNFIPFYFAQEQAYKRLGRLLAEDPGGFRRYQMEMTYMMTLGGTYTGPDGKQYFVLPGSGLLDKGVSTALSHMGLRDDVVDPANFALNLGASGAMFPFTAEGVRPDFGPLVGIPTKGIEDLMLGLMPQDSRTIRHISSDILGNIAESSSLRSQFIPNSIVNRAIDVVDADHGNAFYSSMVHSIMMMSYLGKVPPEGASAQERQKFIDEVRQMTRVNYGLKLALGLISPFAPDLQIKDLGFPAKLQQEISKAGNVAAGLINYSKKYPNGWEWAVPDTTSKNLTGVAIPETASAQKWVSNHYSLVEQYPLAAAYFIPSTAAKDAFDYGAEKDYLAQHLRAKYPLDVGTANGQDFLSQLYISAGNATYYNVLRPAHLASLILHNGKAKDMDSALALVPKLLPTDITALERTGAGKNVERDYNRFLAQFQKQHPIWTANFLDTGNTAVRRASTISQMKDMFAKGIKTSSPLQKPIQGLIHDYEKISDLYAAGVDDAWQQYKESALQDSWVQFLQRVSSAHPELSGIIQGVFLEYWPPNA